MHISTIELAKISKLLIAVDQGKAHEYAGKCMQDIDLDDIPGITDEVEVHMVHGNLDEKHAVPYTLCKKPHIAHNKKSAVDEGVLHED